MTNNWRLIIDKPRDGYSNMAVDKAIMTKAEIPTVRFYQWKPPAVSIGCFQGLEEEVDVKKCEELGIDFVRRITGGGAVFHDKEITYSIIIPEKNPFIPQELQESYQTICQAIILGFKNLGLKAKYVPLNDITVNNKKISGCAQTRRAGKLLQHGTLLIEVDLDKMFSLLKVPDEKIKDKLLASAKERVTSINKELQENIPASLVIEAMSRGFEEYFGISFFEKGLEEQEEKLAQKIKEERFCKKEWNYAR